MRNIASEAFKEKSDKRDVGGTHIGLHRDLAEFQYDIRDKTVFFRPLNGWWPEALKQAAGFKRLTDCLKKV